MRARIVKKQQKKKVKVIKKLIVLAFIAVSGLAVAEENRATSFFDVSGNIKLSAAERKVEGEITLSYGKTLSDSNHLSVGYLLGSYFPALLFKYEKDISSTENNWILGGSVGGLFGYSSYYKKACENKTLYDEGSKEMCKRANTLSAGISAGVYLKIKISDKWQGLIKGGIRYYSPFSGFTIDSVNEFRYVDIGIRRVL